MRISTWSVCSRPRPVSTSAASSCANSAPRSRVASGCRASVASTQWWRWPRQFANHGFGSALWCTHRPCRCSSPQRKASARWRRPLRAGFGHQTSWCPGTDGRPGDCFCQGCGIAWNGPGVWVRAESTGPALSAQTGTGCYCGQSLDLAGPWNLFKIFSWGPHSFKTATL